MYEERSLGVYANKHDDDDANDDTGNGNDNGTPALSYVGTHLRRQLSFDLWFVFLGYFILAISEGSKVQAGRFAMFDVLFEVVSAYGTVGLSLGARGTDCSLSSQFSVVGKLVIVALEIRGRHRGLPYGLDRAVLLPSEGRFRSETMERQMTLVGSTTIGRSGVLASGSERRGSDARQSLSLVRGRTVSHERPNSNLITQFLHPGPAIPHTAMHPQHRRTMSAETAPEFLEPQRSRAETAVEDEEDLAPLPTISNRSVPRRADTSPHF